MKNADLYRDLGMDVVADDDRCSMAWLAIFQEDGRAWVATAVAPVGPRRR
ncbi:MAG: hypothetical protein M3137_20445 [Actinomycetota bacterium]|nr:hypothetical protein [Actinomycetota bacterium]